MFDEWVPAVRAFKEHEDDTVVRIATKAGWWSLSVTTLEKIGAYLGSPVSGGENLYDTLLQLTQVVLPGASDDELLSFLRHRLKRVKKQAAFSEELLSMDDALVCLDEADQAEVHRQQQEAKDKQKEGKKLKESFRKHACEVRIKRATTARAKKAATKPTFRGPATPLSGVMSQSEAKLRMPEGPPKTYLWRANKPGAWLGRVADMPVISRNDSHYGGEQFALRLVLQGVWVDWLNENGFEFDQCPIPGLLDVVDSRPGAAASSGGAGSSGGAA